MTLLSDQELAAVLKTKSQELGFHLAGIAPASRPGTFEHLADWIAQGKQGVMEYIPRRLEAYANPNKVLDGVRSVIMVALNYGPGEHDTGQVGRIAAYAQGTVDYHDLMRDRLRQLADELHAHRPGARTRVVVDTAPLLERDFARQSGLGWFGKNTMLINKRLGSFVFLGALLTDCPLPDDGPHVGAHCGTCTRCLEVCPTGAFDAPFVLDARKCISYLTIELRGEMIPEEFYSGIGEWLFGCDLCQSVCPWNRRSPPATEVALSPALQAGAEACDFVSIGEAEFEQRFGQTPLSRPGWAGMARNAVIVLGNRGDSRSLTALRGALNHPDSIVRNTASQVLSRLEAPSDERVH